MMNFTELPQTHTHVVEPDYIDRMGHMNVMYYTHVFDKATLGFFELFGFGLPYFEQNPSGSMAVERHTRYINELREDEGLTIYSRAIDRGRSSIHFMHFMLRERDNQLAATTEMITLHIDMAARKAAPFPAEIGAQYDTLLRAHMALGWDAPLCGGMGIRKK